MKQIPGNPNPSKRKQPDPDACIEGRSVYIVTRGGKTATINICSAAKGQKGEYESKIRIQTQGLPSTNTKETLRNVVDRAATLTELRRDMDSLNWEWSERFHKYEAWSANWLMLRNQCNVDRAYKMWKATTPDPTNWLRLEHGWKGKLYTYRHENPKPGEKEIEKLLFPEGKDENRTEGKSIEIQLNGKKIGRLTATYHQPPLANQSKEQRTPDVAATVELGKLKRPAMVEVKVTDRNPWYALIECLQQVHMARAYPELKSICPGTNQGGVWGVVLAPKKYFNNKKHEKHMEACMELLRRLKGEMDGTDTRKEEGTVARIAFATSDRLEKEEIIEILPEYHNWSLKRGVR